MEDMRRLNFFVGSNRPWQPIKTLKTKIWLRRLTQLMVSMVHGRYIHFFVCKMCKEAITGELVCSWQNLLWTTETWTYSVLYCHSQKLKTVRTYLISFDFVIRNLSVILWKLLNLGVLKVLPCNLLLWNIHRI